MNIIYAIISISIIYSYALIDSEHILKKEYIVNHMSRFYNRSLVFGLLVLFNPIMSMFFALSFWVLFDYFLNNLRGLKWDYIGSVANSDQFAHKHSNLYWGSKIISLIGAALILFL